MDRLFEGAVKHQPGRSDKGFAGEVFLVAGLFSNQHDLRMLWAFAEHGLSGVFPQRAGSAMGRLFAQDFEAG